MDAIPIELNGLAGWLERFMAEEKYSVQELAEKLNISRQTVYNVLAGGWPSRQVMEKLGMVLVFKTSPAVTEREIGAL